MMLKKPTLSLALLLLTVLLLAFPPLSLGAPVRGSLRTLKENGKNNDNDNGNNGRERNDKDAKADDAEEKQEHGNNAPGEKEALVEPSVATDGVAAEEGQAAAEEVTTATSEGSIAGIVEFHNDLGTLLTALRAAGRLDSLQDGGPYTLFAPTNQAFVEAQIDFLLDPEWILHLEAVLLYHLAEGVFATSDLVEGQKITSVFENEPINVTSVDPATFNLAELVQGDIEASNGVVHVIDEVLFPEFTEVTTADLVAGIPEQFSTLVGLLETANLTDTLGDDDGVFTVFAPNNDAFAKLDASTLELLGSEEGEDLLEDILLYHVVPGVAYATGVEMADTAETLHGANITVTSVDPNVVINGQSTVISGDILTRNGVIHIIDTVLIPPEDIMDDDNATDVANQAPPETGAIDLETWVFQDMETYSTLYTLLNATGLTEALGGPGPLTLFAPDDDAFGNVPNAEKYLQPEWYAHLYDILLYHVVPGIQDTLNLTLGAELLTGVGENITITSEDPWIINNVSTIVDPDNMVSNGVVHGVDEVLLPPSAVYDIVDVVEASPFFEQLLGLLQTAGLEDALGGPGPYTIFAPTNNAVALMEEDVTAVVKSTGDTEKLQEILKYHVVPGIILSDDVAPGDKFETLQGCQLTLSQEGQGYYINDAQILDADILASNGVIHVINSVLVPAADCEKVTPDAPPTEPLTSPPTGNPTAKPETLQPTANPAPSNTTDAVDAVQEVSGNATEPPVEEPAPETPITEDAGAASGTPMRSVALAAIVSSIVPFLLLA